MTKRRLTCAVCGDFAGRWEQWFNQDTGFGVCISCVNWMRDRGTTDDQLRDYYGTEGVNWGVTPGGNQ